MKPKEILFSQLSETDFKHNLRQSRLTDKEHIQALYSIIKTLVDSLTMSNYQFLDNNHYSISCKAHSEEQAGEKLSTQGINLHSLINKTNPLINLKELNND